MPTCSDIITRAYQKVKILASGEEPTADEAADGLTELQSLYEQWAANGLFGRITDVLTADDYEAGQNERIRATDGATVTLPTEYDDEIEGGEKPPYDLAFVEIIDVDAETVERHLWENGGWVSLTGLALGDEAPLASKGSAGLSACLALALADEFGGTVGPTVARQAASFKMALSLKLGSSAQRTAPDYY